MDQLKTYAVPLIALALLGVWFFGFKPKLDDEATAEAEAQAPAEQKGEATGKPEVVPLDPMVRGDLGAPVIRDVIENNLDGLVDCYEQALKHKPDTSGRVVIRIVIRGEGTVRSAGLAGSQVKDDDVGRCMSTHIAGLSFPESDGGGSTEATYPFQLQLGAG